MSQSRPSAYAAYEATGQTLAERILALIPEHLEILNIRNPFELFRIAEFHCDDLAPSFAQAGAALALAKSRYLQQQRVPEEP